LAVPSFAQRGYLRRMNLITAALILAFVPHAVASAQAHSPSQTAAGLQVTELRLEHRSLRRTAGWMLMGWGIANAAGGGIVAAVEHDRAEWVAAGLVSASFGVVNALLAPTLMDLSGMLERTIRREQHDVRSDFAAIRERERVTQLKIGQTFAFNAGLDVFYIATGLLLYALGSVQNPRVAWEQGAGLALVAQGIPLLVFDVYNWIAANDRADALR
jgi:hypothetical protein